MRAWHWRLLAADLPVSSALGYVHQLFYAPRVSQGLGILHVLAGDLVQGAADGCHGLIRQHAGAGIQHSNELQNSILTPDVTGIRNWLLLTPVQEKKNMLKTDCK